MLPSAAKSWYDIFTTEFEWADCWRKLNPPNGIFSWLGFVKPFLTAYLSDCCGTYRSTFGGQATQRPHRRAYRGWASQESHRRAFGGCASWESHRRAFGGQATHHLTFWVWNWFTIHTLSFLWEYMYFTCFLFGSLVQRVIHFRWSTFVFGFVMESKTTN